MSSGPTQISHNAVINHDHCAISTRTGTALAGARRRKQIRQTLGIGERVGIGLIALRIGQGLRLACSCGRRRSGVVVVVIPCWGRNDVW